MTQSTFCYQQNNTNLKKTALKEVPFILFIFPIKDSPKRIEIELILDINNKLTILINVNQEFINKYFINEQILAFKDGTEFSNYFINELIMISFIKELKGLKDICLIEIYQEFYILAICNNGRYNNNFCIFTYDDNELKLITL